MNKFELERRFAERMKRCYPPGTRLLLLSMDPVINPDREKIRQNGPRVRKNGAPSFCITVVDRHGIMHKGRIRRLVPQECFRLMGFTDEQFFELINKLGLADSKLYKLAGNSIMVPILVDILSRKSGRTEKFICRLPCRKNTAYRECS